MYKIIIYFNRNDVVDVKAALFQTTKGLKKDKKYFKSGSCDLHTSFNGI